MKRSDAIRRTARTACAAAAMWVAAGCYTVPETGRSALVLLDFPTEMRMGLQAFEQVKQERQVSVDPEANAMVRRVGERIAAVADRDIPGAEWEFICFEDDTPNAFALPGGKVGVHTGILPLAEDDAGLATVVAHEIGHVAARHGAERISQGLVMGVAGAALYEGVSDRSERERQMAMIAYGVGSTLGITLPHSRRAEYEADTIGLMYMARAGYDPQAALGFWERMVEFSDEQGGSGMPEFLSTHPVDENRIRRLRTLMPRALEIYRGSAQESLGVPSAGAAVRASPVVRAVPVGTAGGGVVRALPSGPVQR